LSGERARALWALLFVIINLLPSIKIYASNLTERLSKEASAVNQAAAATAAFYPHLLPSPFLALFCQNLPQKTV